MHRCLSWLQDRHKISGHPTHRFNQNKGEPSRGVYHTQNINAYQSGLKGWMERLKVPTKYPDNYTTSAAYIDTTRSISCGICKHRFLAMSCIDGKKFATSRLL